MPAAVDLSRLPAPEAVETIPHDVIVAAMRADLVARDPSLADIDQTDPITKNLQVTAYREVLLRQRGNESVTDVMLAFAHGANLRHLGALFGVEALVLDPGDPDNGIAPTYEDDEDLRARIVAAPEAYSVAGPEGAYEAFARGADPQVLDVQVTSPAGAEVLLTILSRADDGVANEALIAKVVAAVSAKTVRPIGDRVTVVSAASVDFQVEAVLYVLDGPDASVVLTQARARLVDYLASRRKLNRGVSISGIMAALHVAGVERVELISPVGDIEPGPGEFARCTASTVFMATEDEEGE